MYIGNNMYGMILYCYFTRAIITAYKFYHDSNTNSFFFFYYYFVCRVKHERNFYSNTEFAISFFFIFYKIIVYISYDIITSICIIF